MNRRHGVGFVKRGCHGAVIVALALIAAPASAQSTYDLELGGGMRVGPVDEFTRGLAVNAALVRWLGNQQWGIAARVVHIVHGTDLPYSPPGKDITISAREYGTFFHIMARHRWFGENGREIHLGVGGVEVRREGIGSYVDHSAGFGLYLEILASGPVTDAIHVRYGIRSAKWLGLHPMVMAVWKFGQP